ncbi:GntR family transcriptional regulator / MocR family aminotransferase [Streptomyces sp. yr375]|uniref:MocR-like pyridoxine biosynthesis transcription factor PdxR n=1 Tax=Streptomyces sp. yr375 TaxID=1761906 RepID=UPI0008BDEA70|nr:PLP-dependent aminotransferase family protein [Streptomyces sp. yr375]SEQ54298.1 GntR family transcriptional regulator / MocR family aminotransferase [Streptomyces sp. yr375]
MATSWVNSAERIGADLHLAVEGPGGRRAALIRALREAVRSGRLAPGTRLPPYRSLAADLGVARNTVADAYAELVAEGWLTARQGSGTRVAERAEPLRHAERTPVEAPPRARGPRHDLRQGTPDASSFPRAAWLASYRRAIQQAPNEVFGPGDPTGRRELREALTEYLARARGVRTEPDRIVICSGFAHALRLLFTPAFTPAFTSTSVPTSVPTSAPGSGVLRGPLAVEAYGLDFHRELLAAAGVRTTPLPLDADGARVEQLGRERAVLLTPAHQFPTGGPLHASRRTAVIDWARARGGVLVEDDYDGEFRYDRKPVGAVQGLDPERVIYVGSVSKSLSPALRLGWLVLPERYVGGVLAAKGEREAWASVPDQLALADLIASGAYDRHVRRMRQRYRGRRDRLVEALAAHAPHVEVTGVAAGLHAVLRLPPGTERSTVRAAARQGVALDGLAAFRHPATDMAPQDGLVVGYATPSEHAYGAALDALCRALPATEHAAGSPAYG